MFFRRPISTILGALALTFLVALGVFYAQTGSMEAAGAKMDIALSDAAEETGEAIDQLADRTGEAIGDMTDGETTTD